ncbi:mitochondrial transcription rescue factor 1 [Phlebotomus argentipes]|uniref:mitochondrial transcription rescue factor 1 n=1 Tax=Phlebotomus argentipes TaxID=94469 RepID=UPI0028930929|nr:mitochondrial transcription rescue factor 1 [Phlebotomus argentipes]
MSCRQVYKLLNLCNRLEKVNFLRRNVAILSQRMFLSSRQSPVHSASVIRVPVRHKYTGKGKASGSKDEDSDSDADELEELQENDKNLIKSSVTSLRADLLIRTGLGTARNKVETKFYEGKIRVNGKKIPKKSYHVKVGDEIDVIKNVSPNNPEHLVISRLELVSATPKEESISVLLRRFKTLVVDNYDERDAYKESDKSEG